MMPAVHIHQPPIAQSSREASTVRPDPRPQASDHVSIDLSQAQLVAPDQESSSRCFQAGDAILSRPVATGALGAFTGCVVGLGSGMLAHTLTSGAVTGGMILAAGAGGAVAFPILTCVAGACCVRYCGE